MKKVNIINNSLKNDVKTILEDKLEVYKGMVGDFSIEVTEKNPRSFSSYIYKNEEDRDSDMKTITELLETNVE